MKQCCLSGMKKPRGAIGLRKLAFEVSPVQHNKQLTWRGLCWVCVCELSTLKNASLEYKAHVKGDFQRGQCARSPAAYRG
jgi:hypothetical protein